MSCSVLKRALYFLKSQRFFEMFHEVFLILSLRVRLLFRRCIYISCPISIVVVTKTKTCGFCLIYIPNLDRNILPDSQVPHVHVFWFRIYPKSEHMCEGLYLGIRKKIPKMSRPSLECKSDRKHMFLSWWQSLLPDYYASDPNKGYFNVAPGL